MTGRVEKRTQMLTICVGFEPAMPILSVSYFLTNDVRSRLHLK